MIRQTVKRLTDSIRSGIKYIFPSVAAPHFVVDQRRQVHNLIKSIGKKDALIQAVGGSFGFGKLEAELLRYLGLRGGQYIVDVGCGSGRLASALAGWPDIRYLGTDVVPELLDHARAVSPSHFRFTLVNGLTIPEDDNVADYVVLFSVATHLLHHEAYLYLLEAKRVLKPGGRIVLSFLEFANPAHWKPFVDTVDSVKNNLGHPVNTLIEASAIEVWADHLTLEVERMFRADSPRIELPNPISRDDGRKVTHFRNIGQSAAVLRKPQPSVGASSD
jgi:ubiquinone/menaquinone biosynthesis C-methylase UbiE